MSHICPQDICTGCWACVNICPKSSITMVEGELLHLFPQIDQVSCIDCGLCKTVCPAINTVTKHTPIGTYAAWARDEQEYKSSTSGGVASILAHKIIEDGGVVYGCAMTPKINVSHIRVTEIGDIDKLKGSKYVQSSIGDVYKRVKSDLIVGCRVLFIGTPCQIAGLRNYLRIEYSNLVLVDLICHGVPSLGFLKEHIKNVTDTEVDNVSFRNGPSYILCAYAKGEEKYRNNLWKDRYTDAYYNAFIDGYSFRTSCHKCQYACQERVSDITIGDFWGLDDRNIEPHPYGVSCILTNTENGKHLFDSIKSELIVYERKLVEAVNGNEHLRHPSPINWRIKLFYKSAKKKGVIHAYRLSEFDHIHHIYDIPVIGKVCRILLIIVNKLCND